MQSRSDDVRHKGTDDSLAQFHPRHRTMSTMQQSSLRDNPPSVSGETTSRIASNQLSHRNGELYTTALIMFGTRRTKAQQGFIGVA
ncbi:unnamed protein product [Protopolystoma xenopodis]|uniref:Uncharacterized protein n=1 Tax=Protopolystoma xenopodis TaxID=117903 RepID=A0A3S5BQ19_9PLAT|nr:unnamed protein product [Protopolystoma xenopodis]